MTTAIVGRVGSGKTYTAKFIATKALIEGRRVCIIDPTDAWWGLRLQSDGESPSGLNVWIFGGDHSDIAITPDHGERLGELVATGAVPQSIISLADFTSGEITRFMTAFLEELYRRNRGAIELVVDEADAICPQNPMPDQRRMSGALDKIVRRGRIKGFRPTLITQRPAVLHKNVLSQASTLIAMRLTSPHDRKAIEGWVKGNADAGDARRVLDSLAALKVGEGWDWSPAAGILERRQFPLISTYDSSRAPEHDEDERQVKPLASAEIARIREIFAAASEDEKVSSSAKTPAQFTQQIASAEARGKAAGFEAGRRRGALSAIRSMRSELEALLLRWADYAKELASQWPDAVEEKAFEFGKSGYRPSKPDAAAPANGFEPEAGAEIRKNLRRATPAPSDSGAGNFNSAAKKMMAVIDTNPPVSRSWTQIATLAGIKARGGHFNAGRKALLANDAVVEIAGLVRLKRVTIGAPKPASSPQERVELWASALSGAAPKILRALFEFPKTRSREAIAQHLGMMPRGGHWNAAWKELRDNEIVMISGDAVELTEAFRS